MDSKYIFSVIGIALLLLILIAINQLIKSVKRINLTLDKIAQKIGVADPAGDDLIKSLIVDCKKIEAIKRYRELTGAGLKEAADYVEKLTQSTIP
ncbi:ribosomal protein L7/L12 [Ruminiclostridium herbifermentans]|uniref:Ribosomal protein L7/L12 n=1 Tax=Ruminiclostridium herbifermentans TaxID=2488810 RepID=A0A4U7JLB4_9FIRM|nr:ribosomal protein L7/L12 [Ruminiclostridium herbifermentans]QNU66024.1 ribosomal protein L7/L12 [Ruminiclostridium herbifermentans]